MTARDAALDKLTAALAEYSALCPKRPERTEPPKIEPTVRHCTPDNFHVGTNMMLDAGGYMPGKIPVVVVPARVEDLGRYARYRSVPKLLAALGLSL